MWLRNCWYVAGWSHEVGPADVVGRTIIGEPVVLYRREDGTPVVMEDRCCHRLAPLSKGRREGDDLRCMYHGMKFAPDGRCLEIPGQTSIPDKARVRTYPVAESGSWIWVWMGAADKADRDLIPASISLQDTSWALEASALDYTADYQLINDNLLDLTHLAFVHENTLGRGMPQWGAERPRVVRLDRGVRFQRWIRDVDASHFLGHLATRFDLWHHYDFLVPGIFLQRTNFHAAGTAARWNGEPPQEGPLFCRLDEQAVTPFTESTARYFYSVGARSSDAAPAFVARIRQHAERAFHEDKVIIEGQYQHILRDPQRPMIATNSDAGPNMFRALMKGLMDRERRDAQSVAAA